MTPQQLAKPTGTCCPICGVPLPPSGMHETEQEQNACHISEFFGVKVTDMNLGRWRELKERHEIGKEAVGDWVREILSRLP